MYLLLQVRFKVEYSWSFFILSPASPQTLSKCTDRFLFPIIHRKTKTNWDHDSWSHRSCSQIFTLASCLWGLTLKFCWLFVKHWMIQSQNIFLNCCLVMNRPDLSDGLEQVCPVYRVWTEPGEAAFRFHGPHIWTHCQKTSVLLQLSLQLNQGFCLPLHFLKSNLICDHLFISFHCTAICILLFYILFYFSLIFFYFTLKSNIQFCFSI